MEKFLDINEAAAILGVGSDTVRKLCKQLKVAHTRSGDGKWARYMFSETDLEAYMRRGVRVEATPLKGKHNG